MKIIEEFELSYEKVVNRLKNKAILSSNINIEVHSYADDLDALTESLESIYNSSVSIAKTLDRCEYESILKTRRHITEALQIIEEDAISFLNSIFSDVAEIQMSDFESDNELIKFCKYIVKEVRETFPPLPKEF